MRAIQFCAAVLDCFVASLLAMTTVCGLREDERQYVALPRPAGRRRTCGARMSPPTPRTVGAEPALPRAFMTLSG